LPVCGSLYLRDFGRFPLRRPIGALPQTDSARTSYYMASRHPTELPYPNPARKSCRIVVSNRRFLGLLRQNFKRTGGPDLYFIVHAYCGTDETAHLPATKSVGRAALHHILWSSFSASE